MDTNDIQTGANNQTSSFRLPENKRKGILKLTQARIRDKIQDALSRRPMGVIEIANHQHLFKTSVKRHLDHLILIGIVESFEKNGHTYFRLTR